MGGGGHFPHCRHEVAAADGDGGDVQQELLGGAVNLRVPAAQSAERRLCAHCPDVGATVTWKRKAGAINALQQTLQLFIWHLSYQHISLPVQPENLQREEASTAGCEFLGSPYVTETQNNTDENVFVVSTGGVYRQELGDMIHIPKHFS